MFVVNIVPFRYRNYFYVQTALLSQGEANLIREYNIGLLETFQ